MTEFEKVVDLEYQVHWVCKSASAELISRFLSMNRCLPRRLINQLNDALDRVNEENRKRSKGIIYIVETENKKIW